MFKFNTEVSGLTGENEQITCIELILTEKFRYANVFSYRISAFIWRDILYSFGYVVQLNTNANTIPRMVAIKNVFVAFVET